MYSKENISTILDFRNPPNAMDNEVGDYDEYIPYPDDELILLALDLVRKFIETPEPTITISEDVLGTEIDFRWKINDGYISYFLTKNGLDIFAVNNEGKIIVDMMLKEEDYISIDFVTIFLIKMINNKLT